MGLSCQFAVTAWDLSSPAALAGLPQQAKRAEAMGFEGFWLPEHHFQGGASLSAPLILLAACASATDCAPIAARVASSRKGDGASSMTFWLRRWIEHSRSCR